MRHRPTTPTTSSRRASSACRCLAATAVAGIVAVATFAVSYVADLDLFEGAIGIMRALEHGEADELVVAAAIVAVGLVVDTARGHRRRTRELERERMRAYRATISTVHDVVHNAFNNLVLLQVEAEDAGCTCSASRRLFDDVMRSTVGQLERLGSLDEVAFVDVATGIEAIRYDHAPAVAPEDSGAATIFRA